MGGEYGRTSIPSDKNQEAYGMAAGCILAIQHIAGTSSGRSGIDWVGIGEQRPFPPPSYPPDKLQTARLPDRFVVGVADGRFTGYF